MRQKYRKKITSEAAVENYSEVKWPTSFVEGSVFMLVSKLQSPAGKLVAGK